MCIRDSMFALTFPDRWEAYSQQRDVKWNDHTLSDHFETHIYAAALCGKYDMLRCMMELLLAITLCPPVIMRF